MIFITSRSIEKERECEKERERKCSLDMIALTNWFEIAASNRQLRSGN